MIALALALLVSTPPNELSEAQLRVAKMADQLAEGRAEAAKYAELLESVRALRHRIEKKKRHPPLPILPEPPTAEELERAARPAPKVPPAGSLPADQELDELRRIEPQLAELLAAQRVLLERKAALAKHREELQTIATRLVR